MRPGGLAPGRRAKEYPWRRGYAIRRLEHIPPSDQLRFEKARERLLKASTACARLVAGESPSRWADVPMFDFEDLAEACRELREAEEDFWRLCKELFQDVRVRCVAPLFPRPPGTPAARMARGGFA